MYANEFKANSEYIKRLDELTRLTHELDPWYDPYKVRWYAIYVKSKESDDNLFDILEDEIVYYDDAHIIPSEAMYIVGKIQSQLKKVNDWFDEAIQNTKGA